MARRDYMAGRSDQPIRKTVLLNDVESSERGCQNQCIR